MVVERPAALDVHKEQVTACVRVPIDGGGREQHLAEFATTVRGLLGLRDWLAAHRVQQVTMEATGVYWKPVWAILEDEFPLLLVNARHVKQVPGRKTDVTDSAWLCQLAEAGLLRASFVPPRPIRALRNLTRYRKTQIQERAREANRLHKALEDTGIKLDCVASDILGASGRAMLAALIDGTTDPELLAELARGRLRAKLPALKEALEGRFDRLHGVWIGAILAHVDFLDEQIDRLSDAIEEQIAPFAAAVELLCTIPGVQRRAAETIIAEIGTDMSVFPSAKHLASWAGQCPGNDQSAGHRRSGRTRSGSKWLDWTLEEAALAAVRSKDVYLAAQYNRLRPRRGHKKALGAVKHSILCACWHMLTTGELYHDLGGDYFQRRDPERTSKRLIAQRLEEERAVPADLAHADRLVQPDRRQVLGADEEGDGRRHREQQPAEVAHPPRPVALAAGGRVDPHLLHLDDLRRPGGRLGLEEHDAALAPEPRAPLDDLRAGAPAEALGVVLERIDAELALVRGGADRDQGVEVVRSSRAAGRSGPTAAARRSRRRAGPGDPRAAGAGAARPPTTARPPRAPRR